LRNGQGRGIATMGWMNIPHISCFEHCTCLYKIKGQLLLEYIYIYGGCQCLVINPTALVKFRHGCFSDSCFYLDFYGFLTPITPNHCP
jgi:hypothetical protein